MNAVIGKLSSGYAADTDIPLLKPDGISLLAKFIDRVRTIGDEKYALVAQCLTDGVHYEPRATILIVKLTVKNPDSDPKITEIMIRLLEKEEGQLIQHFNILRGKEMTS